MNSIRRIAGLLLLSWSFLVNAAPVPLTTPYMSTDLVLSNRVVFTWSSVPAATGYVIERGSGYQGPFSVLASVPASGAILTYTDTAVIIGENWWYRLKAVEGTNSSDYSLVLTIQIPAPQPPRFPSVFRSEGTVGSGVTIQWFALEEADGYVVRRRTEETLGLDTVARLPAVQTSYLDTNVLAGVQYWYEVVATNSIGESQPTPTRVVVTEGDFPLVSSDFETGPDPRVWSRILGGSIVDHAAGFRDKPALWFGTNSTRLAEMAPIPILGPAQFNFTIRIGGDRKVDGPYWDSPDFDEIVALEYSTNGVSWTGWQSLYPFFLRGAYGTWNNYSFKIPVGAYSPQTQFRWRQSYHSGAGWDTWALESVRVVSDLPLFLAAPQILEARANANGSVSVRWGISAGAMEYRIERRDPNHEWAPVAFVPTAVTAYLDTAAQQGVPYVYRIQAMNSFLESAYSLPAAVTPPPAAALKEWLVAHYGRSDLPMESPDSSGLTLLERYAYRLSATGPAATVTDESAGGLPRVWRDSESGRLQVQFVRRNPSMHPGLEYRVQFSDDLLTWQPADAALSTLAIDETWQRVRFLDPVANASNRPARFARVVLVLTP